MDLRVKPEDDRGGVSVWGGAEDDKFYTRCHSRGSGNPGQMKTLCFLDLRVKPEDDNAKNCPKMTGFIPVVIPAEAEIQDKRRPYVSWISGSSPKMTILKKTPEDDGGE